MYDKIAIIHNDVHFRMIEYRSVVLANQFNAPQVTIKLERKPMDITYAAFILAEIQTGNYEDCFASLINAMETEGT